ncbi:hypothetical protein E2562_003376 [Oryza meyeriana var. granulata]|uniref:Auxin-responsive protein n=1 Tax=Oryza meyeriana var. granulata TaxID=110450 RepID=A0A6G1EFH7_9ORYZ|nr:hypothetical protein E2562_003376 [Oryza meyeriana var. granulata]
MECCKKASDHEESPTSSMESCSGEPTAPAQSTASSGCRPPATTRRRGLTTDLHLGLTLSSVHTDYYSTPSTPRSALTTATTADRGGGGHGRRRSLFVKVYMEGVPIGRKLDLLLLDGYDCLVAQLAAMFRASITYPDHAIVGCHEQLAVVGKTKKAHHVLTYEDREGDWMMAGDAVPGKREEIEDCKGG